MNLHRRSSSSIAHSTVLVLLASTAFGTAQLAAADVAENWMKHCASCHGKDGKGQTKAGKMAGSKDMTDAAYQATLKDDKMFTSVKDGVKDKGRDLMKPFAGKLTDDEIKALVAHVRTLKQ
jgi:cytochrome c553